MAEGHVIPRTRRWLVTTTAMTTAAIPMVLVGAGAIMVSPGAAFAQESTKIPLEYVYKNDGSGKQSVSRLGIWVGVNDGKARRYLFDTGSDQFNAGVGNDAKATPGAPLKHYAYGDGTYGYSLQQTDFNKLSYFGKDNIASPVKVLNGRYQLAKITDDLYTKDSSFAGGVHLSPKPVCVASTDENDSKCYKPGHLDNDKIYKEYHADLDARKKIEDGLPFEEGDIFSGTFGAADFLFSSSLPSSALPGMTKSGFVVAANSENGEGANSANPATPGCSPCAIVNVNAAVRAQFKSIMPWGNQPRKGFVGQFPGEQGNASTMYEGAYTLKAINAQGDGQLLVSDLPVLLDTGTPGGGTLKLVKAEFDELYKTGVIKLAQKDNPTDPDAYEIDLSIAAPKGEEVDLYRVSVEASDTGKTEFTAGLDFFRSQSVVFDFEKKTTAYTPYFVSADNFTTNSGDKTTLSLITPKMGNQLQRPRTDENGNQVLGQNGQPVWAAYGLFGVAGVISGAGSLTLAPYSDVRMTNINTYTGETIISKNAFLSLAGLGSISQSARVVANGNFDVSERGSANDYWGLQGVENDAVIRSLAGSGSVDLGGRTLVLTAANDEFSGGISDTNADGQHKGGGLKVVGGAQTLSGQNDYTGLTTVGKGAALRLTESGSITNDVVVAGLLGNDGKIGDVVTAQTGGVVTGSGSFWAIDVAKGARVAPGNTVDPAKQIATMTVGGDFRQQSGSIYEAGIGQTSDLIDIAGTAGIESEAQVELLRQGAVSTGTRYTLLTAAKGVDGTYSGLTGTLVTNSPFVDFELAYDPTNVFLDVNRTSTAFADVGRTFNQRSTATASEALGGGNPIYDSILLLTEQEARNAFDLLSGEIHASARGALIEDSHFIRDAASERIRAAFDGVAASAVPVMAYGPGGPEAAPATSENFAIWGRGFGAWGHLDGNGNAARLDRSTGGFIAGGDALVGENWRLGLLAGYSHMSFDVDNRSSSGSSDNYHLGLYAGTQHGNLGFRSGLAYTWHRMETHRSVLFPGFSDSLPSDYDAGSFQAFGELGYRIDTATASFEPYGNLAYVHLKTDGFSETGGPAALYGSGGSSDTTFTTLGLRASSDLQFAAVPITLRGGLAWRHAFGGVTPEATLTFSGSDAFAVRGTPIAKDASLVEAGLDVNFTQNASIGLVYQGQIASNAQEHGFNAKLEIRF